MKASQKELGRIHLKEIKKILSPDTRTQKQSKKDLILAYLQTAIELVKRENS